MAGGIAIPIAWNTLPHTPSVLLRIAGCVPFSSKTSFLFNLVQINRGAVLFDLEVSSVPLVAHHCFGTLGDFFFQRLEDRLPGPPVLFGLSFINTHDIPPAHVTHFLDLQGRRIFGFAPDRVYLLVTTAAGKHELLHFFVFSQPGSQDIGDIVILQMLKVPFAAKKKQLLSRKNGLKLLLNCKRKVMCFLALELQLR